MRGSIEVAPLDAKNKKRPKFKKFDFEISSDFKVSIGRIPLIVQYVMKNSKIVPINLSSQ